MRVSKITPVGKKEVYDISVQDAEHYVLENGIVTHNTGVYYSADTIFIIGRSQEKNSKGLQGWNFTINIEKSRFVKEKSKIPITVTFSGGVDKFSGLRELAEEGGFIKRAGESYFRVFLDETEKQKVAIKSQTNDVKREWWKEVLKHKPFTDFVEARYALGSTTMVAPDEAAIIEEIEEVEEIDEVDYAEPTADDTVDEVVDNLDTDIGVDLGDVLFDDVTIEDTIDDTADTAKDVVDTFGNPSLEDLEDED